MLESEGPTRNPLAMYAFEPLGVSFEEQEEGEKILLLLRAHLVTLVPVISVSLLMIIVPLVIFGILDFLRIDLSFLTSGQVFLITIFWYLITFGYAFYQFVFWYFNVYLLTNERIIDFDFEGLLQSQIAYAHLSKIQDVSPKIQGFFATFFHYGDVLIQTAAEVEEFEFNKVARPDDVAQAIINQVSKEEAEAPGRVL